MALRYTDPVGHGTAARTAAADEAPPAAEDGDRDGRPRLGLGAAAVPRRPRHFPEAVRATCRRGGRPRPAAALRGRTRRARFAGVPARAGGPASSVTGAAAGRSRPPLRRGVRVPAARPTGRGRAVHGGAGLAAGRRPAAVRVFPVRGPRQGDGRQPAVVTRQRLAVRSARAVHARGPRPTSGRRRCRRRCVFKQSTLPPPAPLAGILEDRRIE